MLWPHWKIGKDGLPVNPKANPNCALCKGHGIVEDGTFHYASVLIDCPVCCHECKPMEKKAGT
jgi:hypothetical protein